MIEPVFGSPETDPEFAALAGGLSPVAAALVVFSMQGRGACQEAIEAAAKTTPAPDEFHQLTTSAIRWVAHRRRSYGFPNNDPWVIESFLAWAWRANDVVAGRPIDQAEIDKAIRSELVKTQNFSGTVPDGPSLLP